MRTWKVYRLECAEGVYYGVTIRKLSSRRAEHKYRGRDGSIHLIAEFDTKEEALRLERELVPNALQGLNRAPGGGGGWSYRPKGSHIGFCAKETPRGKPKVVEVEGVRYPSITAAAKALGVNKTVAHYRVRSPYFSDWSVI